MVKVSLTMNNFVHVATMLALVMSVVTVENIATYQSKKQYATRKNSMINLAFNGLVLLCVTLAVILYVSKGMLKKKLMVVLLLCSLVPIYSWSIIYHYSMSVYDSSEGPEGILAYKTIGTIKMLNYVGIGLCMLLMVLL